MGEETREDRIYSSHIRLTYSEHSQHIPLQQDKSPSTLTSPALHSHIDKIHDWSSVDVSNAEIQAQTEKKQAKASGLQTASFWTSAITRTWPRRQAPEAESINQNTQQAPTCYGEGSGLYHEKALLSSVITAIQANTVKACHSLELTFSLCQIYMIKITSIDEKSELLPQVYGPWDVSEGA